MNLPARAAALRVFVVAVACFVASACAPDCPEPVYQGGGTDEAWRTMVDAEARATAGGDAPAVTTVGPFATDGDAPTIAWTSAIALAPAPGSRPHVGGGRRRSPLDAVTAWLIPSARAHEPPVTDDVYWARIAIADEACRVEVVTTDERWPLTDDAWARLVDAAADGKAATLSIVSAYLTANRVTEGPFKSADVVLELE